MIDPKACFMHRLIIDTPNVNKSLDLSEAYPCLVLFRTIDTIITKLKKHSLTNKVSRVARLRFQ